MKSKSLLGTIKKLLPIIGIALLIYIIVDIGVGEIASTFISIPIQYYFFALSLFIPRLIIAPYKWQYICKKQKIFVNYLYLMKAFLIGLFYGSITPSGLGWHIRIYYLKKKSKATWEKCIANSVLDAGIGFLPGIILALLGSIVLYEFFPGLSLILILFFAFYLAVIFVLMRKERGGWIFNTFIRPLIPGKFKKSIDQSIDLLYEDLPKMREMIVPILLQFMLWILGTSQVYVFSLAFNIDIPYFTFILIVAICAVVGSLPITVGGLGVREGAFVWILSEFGVEPSVAVVISLTGFLVKELFAGLPGLFLSFKIDKEIIKKEMNMD